MKRFENKVVLVTGGNRNTGLDIVGRFSDEGATVWMCGSTKESTEKGAAELELRKIKGVKAFPFTKTGANGHGLASALLLRPGQYSLIIHQAKSPCSVIPVDELAVQSLSGKGYMQVDALFDDIVTSCSLTEAAPKPEA